MNKLNISEKSALKYIVLAVLAICVWVIIGKVVFSHIDSKIQKTLADEYTSEKYRLLSEIINKLEDEYYSEVPSDTLLQAAIDGLMSKFDNYTYYMNNTELDEFRDDSSGLFNGIGVNVDVIDNYITVKSPRKNSPASNAGIKAGDRIIKVNGKDITGITIEESSKLIRGEVGSNVVISVIHPGEKKAQVYHLKREEIKVPSIPYYFTMKDIGYLRIASFHYDTGQEFKEKLALLEAENINGLIIDLRSNPGGILSQTVQCLDEFIDAGEKIVYTKGRDNKVSSIYITKDNEEDKTYPVIVLINDKSASAAEIFAGTVQDYDLGLVLGEKSYGKGSVQQIFPVSNGGVKITTSHYYLKSGRCIQKTSEHSDDEEYYTINGREVIAGNGIEPDIEINQLELPEIAEKLLSKSLVFKFAVEYIRNNSDKNIENLTKNNVAYSAFKKYIKRNSGEMNIKAMDNQQETIKYLIKSEILGIKLGEVNKYRELLSKDLQVQKALEILNKSDNKKDMFAMINRESK